MVSSIKPEDQFNAWRSEKEADIIVSLASLAGERLFFDGDSSAGVSGDLESATTVATQMEGYWGMGRTIASHGVTHRVGIGGGGGQKKPGEGDDDDRNLLHGQPRRTHRGEPARDLRAGGGAAHRAPGRRAAGHALPRDPQDDRR